MLKEDGEGLREELPSGVFKFDMQILYLLFPQISYTHSFLILDIAIYALVFLLLSILFRHYARHYVR